MTDAVRRFMSKVKDIDVPEGQVRDELPESLQGKSGAMPALHALADCIDIYADISQQNGGNSVLIKRLKGDDTLTSLAGIMGDVAIGGDADKERLLRETLRIRDDDLFERLLVAIKNIATERTIELHINRSGEGRPKVDESGTWMESVHGDGPTVDDEQIRREARKHDDETGAKEIDDVVKDSSGAGDIDKIVDGEQSNYERAENARADVRYLKQSFREGREINGYYNVLLQLKSAYDQTIAQALGQEAGQGFVKQ